MPNPQIILTYRLAALFKLLGVTTAIVAGYFTIWEWGPSFYRWWSAGFGALILLLVIAPWWRLFSEENQPTAAHAGLILGLLTGMLTPHLELLHALYQPYQDLYAYPQFVEILKFTPDQVNNIHGFGQMFIIIPVILATWQYRLKGILWSMPVSGLAYVLITLIMPTDAFNWYFYAIKGFVLLGIALISALITWMLVEATRREQKKLARANRKLAEQALVMEDLAASRERNRLARELHDTMAHSISGATVQLQAVQTLLQVDTAAAATELTQARLVLKDGLAESRRAIATLRATPLEELGLLAALTKEATKIASRTGIQLISNLESNLQDKAQLDLTEIEEQAIYRILSAAMGNIERHSEATQMQIKLTQLNGKPTFIVQDNGKGFLSAAPPPAGRFGLMGMHERASLIGARLDINSQPGDGTTVILFLDRPEPS